MTDQAQDSRRRIIAISLDPVSFPRRAPDVEQERSIALFDLQEGSSFCLERAPDGGPYCVRIEVRDGRLVLAVSDEGGSLLQEIGLSLVPLRGVIRDYRKMCESYVEAIRMVNPRQIEAIDMGRRGLHDEGARLLSVRLEGKIRTDHDTARKLFTLVTTLGARQGDGQA